ncbi:hypothetical protein RCL1_001905 [Eukaryota sp. TZLM3-RCL]
MSHSKLLIPSDLHRRADDLVLVLRPTKSSDERRSTVFNLVARLIRDSVGGYVFQFGSVPLKTYLPDADIDIGCFMRDTSSSDTSWLLKVHETLVNESQRRNQRLEISNPVFINAEVKVIKCFVGDLAVDISANQVGGLCSLCFFDTVDSEIGHHHLFKRSVLFVKSWCTYQSRILGSHAGLFSTYSVQTIILHLFMRYGNLIETPLDLFAFFADFVSSFPWDSHVFTVFGKVDFTELIDGCMPPIEELADRFTPPERPFLTISRLLELSQQYSSVSVANKSIMTDFTNSQISSQSLSCKPFILKALNISDPLNPDNNLGRSVSYANANRIRSALRRGYLCFQQLACVKPDVLPPGVTRVGLFDLFMRDVWAHVPKSRLIENLERARAQMIGVESDPRQPQSNSRDQRQLRKNSITGFSLTRVQTAPPQFEVGLPPQPPLDKSAQSTCSHVDMPTIIVPDVKRPSVIYPKVLQDRLSPTKPINHFDSFASDFHHISHQLSQALMVKGFLKKPNPVVQNLDNQSFSIATSTVDDMITKTATLTVTPPSSSIESSPIIPVQNEFKVVGHERGQSKTTVEPTTSTSSGQNSKKKKESKRNDSRSSDDSRSSQGKSRRKGSGRQKSQEQSKPIYILIEDHFPPLK